LRQVVRIYGENSVKEVDEEGSIKGGKRSSSDSQANCRWRSRGRDHWRIAVGKGAAIGAGIGAGVVRSQVIRGSDK